MTTKSWDHPALHEKKRVLLTGAAGFVGHHFLEHLLLTTNWDIVAMCRMNNIGDTNRYAGNPRLNNPDYAKRVKFIYHDFKYTINDAIHERIGKVDYILHLGANSHVDRSITHPVEFYEDNVMGTVNMLEYARLKQPGVRFLNFSTDEVFGPAPHGVNWKEDDRYYPSNPYSGSKAGAVEAGISHFVTFKVPVITTHTMNIFGQRQNPEKLVPKAIRKILAGEEMTIHCKLKDASKATLDASGAPYSLSHDDVEYVGERHWLHVRNSCDATLFVLLNGVPGEKYNVVGDTELTNDQLVEMIAAVMGKPVKFKYLDFHSCRPGHDRRYALDGTKLKEMGWVPPVSFDESLATTVQWEIDHLTKEE